MYAVLTPRHLHDIGKLLLALVMVWAYFSFSQFLIIWTGNLPEEIPWYLERLRGGWQYVGLLLVVRPFRAALRAAALARPEAQFQVSRAGSRCSSFLCVWCDLYWLVAPDFLKGSFGISWMDFAAPVGLIGLWLAYFLLQLEKRPLMPLNEPHLEEALEHGRE